MSESVAPNTVVAFHFVLRDATGAELDRSEPDAPTVYLHGVEALLPALERALEGQVPGAQLSLPLTPEEAFGVPDPAAVRKVPVKHLSYRGKLKAGQVVTLMTDHGDQAVTVRKVGLHSAEVDTNHPLAGQSVIFDLTVVSVRAATAEEISHGHVHGAGGHHH